MTEKLSTKKTILLIVVSFVLYLAGAFLSSVCMDLLFKVVSFKYHALYSIIRYIFNLVVVLVLLWLCIYKIFRMKFEDFGINLKFKWWGIVAAILIPAYMVCVYLFIGKLTVNKHTAIVNILLILSSLFLGLQSGFLEEILFRGIFMKSLESRWNKKVAVLAPSLLFSLAHIPGLPSFSVLGILVLIVAGTMVGVMFSMVAYKGNSIANSAIIHAVWNFTLIADIFNIAPKGAGNSSAIFSITLPTNNIFISGADFGIEASIFAIIAYVVGSLIFMQKKRK
ncbi:MAG: CPBP family intramembrane metalloprotease [Treponema sp.]|nr:CPBP family intramembrane metalloprotease [Treponema sp.]